MFYNICKIWEILYNTSLSTFFSEFFLINEVNKYKTKGIIKDIEKLIIAILIKCIFAFGKIAIKHPIYNHENKRNIIIIEYVMKNLSVIIFITLFTL